MARMHRMHRDYESKPGRFGTLWRYQYTYRDADGDGPIWTRQGWYYSLEHLERAFYESCEDDTWVLLTARHVPLNGIMASVPTHVFSEW